MWTGVGIQMGTGGALLLMMLVCTAQGSSPSGRSDDPQPLEVIVQNLSSQLAAVQARLAALEGNMHQVEGTLTVMVCVCVCVLSLIHI